MRSFTTLANSVSLRSSVDRSLTFTREILTRNGYPKNVCSCTGAAILKRSLKLCILWRLENHQSQRRDALSIHSKNIWKHGETGLKISLRLRRGSNRSLHRLFLK